jgi:hypothetical protein
MTRRGALILWWRWRQRAGERAKRRPLFLFLTTTGRAHARDRRRVATPLSSMDAKQGEGATRRRRVFVVAAAQAARRKHVRARRRAQLPLLHPKPAIPSDPAHRCGPWPSRRSMGAWCTPWWRGRRGVGARGTGLCRRAGGYDGGDTEAERRKSTRARGAGAPCARRQAGEVRGRLGRVRNWERERVWTRARALLFSRVVC